MKMLQIKRVSTGEYGTFGVIMEVGQPPFALTLEPPWENNEPNISCIPPHTYQCIPVDSPRFGQTWEVADVPDRTHILFHRGNIAETNNSNTQGCILIAEEFGYISSTPGVLSSAKGFIEFLDLIKDEKSFALTIEETY